LKGVASTCTIAFFTSVCVRTSSLLDALYTTSMMRVLRATACRKREEGAAGDAQNEGKESKIMAFPLSLKP
jgi:hypothetical protein